jgi:hypothetical protein
LVVVLVLVMVLVVVEEVLGGRCWVLGIGGSGGLVVVIVMVGGFRD